MKKNYFLSFVMLVCLMTLAVKANAQASGITDLYGKWQFTATVETTEYGKQFAGQFAAESEVVITNDPNGIYPAEISGFAGGAGAFNPYEFYADTQILYIRNAPAVWTGLAMSFAEGGYPYGRDNFYGDLEWTYDDATKTLTIPDFTLVSGFDHNAETAETVAKFTNCKMVLVEAETVEVPSIAGDYNFEPDMKYVRNDSTFTYNFSLSLVATDETNKAYDATVTFDGYEPFNLPATFDGSRVTINFDNLFLDVENKYFFGVAKPAAGKTGAFTFSYVSENALMLWDAIYVRQDSVWTETEVTDEETGEVKIEGKWGFPIIQKLSSGYLVRESEATKGFSWAGTFDVTAKDVIFADEELAATFGEWPSEFQIVIEEKTPGSYYLTEFLGRNPYNATWGASAVQIAEDGKSATLDLTQASGTFYLEGLGGGELLTMYDGMGEQTSLTFTLNDDGTITIDPFFLQKTIYDNSYDPMPIVFYQDMTAVKHIEPFEWASGYFLKADVEVFDTTREYPSEFVAKIEWNEGWGCYLLTEFFNYDGLTTINYGGNSLTLATDTRSATYDATGGYLGCKTVLDPETGWSNPVYYHTLCDKDGGTTALNFTVNEDGTISMDDFRINVIDSEAGGVTVEGALYTNVVLTKGDTTGIDSVVEETETAVEGIFDLSGRKLDEITAPGIYIVNGKKVLVK